MEPLVMTSRLSSPVAFDCFSKRPSYCLLRHAVHPHPPEREEPVKGGRDEDRRRAVETNKGTTSRPTSTRLLDPNHELLARRHFVGLWTKRTMFDPDGT